MMISNRMVSAEGTPQKAQEKSVDHVKPRAQRAAPSSVKPRAQRAAHRSTHEKRRGQSRRTDPASHGGTLNILMNSSWWVAFPIRF